MAIAIGDPPRTSGIQKGRGGFLRSADDKPYVTDPSGELVKSGERKGQIKRIAYGSPSNVGRLIENDVGLVKYKQRNVFLGIGMSDDLREACKALVEMDAGSDEFRNCADLIAVEADKLTRSWLAADRGSHGHAITEAVDRGDCLNLDFIAKGQELGLTAAIQQATVIAWNDLLEDNGLEVLAIEAACVDDQWRLAGTLDRIVRLTRQLRFAMPSGLIVEIPAGTVLVLDIKFGAARRAHLIQIASYAQSKPYDTDTELRGEWPWPISQEHALIAHGDFGGDGRPVTIELMWVDLKAGREHGGQCVVDAKAWSGRDDLWSVAQLDVGEVPPRPGDVCTVPSVRHCTSPTTDVAEDDPASVLDDPEVPVEGVVVLHDLAASSTGTPDDDFHAPMVGPRALDWALKPAAVPTPTVVVDPDEGSSTYIDEAFTELEALFDGLDPLSRAWITALTKQAMHHGVSFHSKDNRTERRYWLIKAVVVLSIAGLAEDEVLRALMVHSLQSDVALFASIAAGHALGAHGAAQAQRLAALTDALVGERLVGFVDDERIYRVRAVA